MKALDWQGATGFNAATSHALIAGNTDGDDTNIASAGDVIGHGPFTFVRVFNAGHMVPASQPAVTLDLFNKFLRSETL